MNVNQIKDFLDNQIKDSTERINVISNKETITHQELNELAMHRETVDFIEKMQDSFWY